MSIPIHPFLFALFHILFLYSINVEQLSYSEILLPSTVALGFTLLLVLLSKLIFRDGRKAAIIISISLILFFSYGHIYDLITDWHVGDFAIGRHRYLLVVCGLVFSCSTFFFIRTRKKLQHLTSTLNFISLTLVVMSLLSIGVYEFKTQNTMQGVSLNLYDPETHASDSGEISASRDIYYIVLDGYASSSTLDEIYHFDNSNFTDYLGEKGFFVASTSRSNYANTFLSLASSLNMQYVNHLSNVVGEESIDRAIPYQMIEDSDVMNFLKMQGYKFIHFSSGWGATDRNRYADLDLHYSKGNEFHLVLIKTTMLNPFARLITSTDERNRRLYTFSELAEVHKIKGPKFIFAHINSPHPPYLFGADGEPVPDAKLMMSGYVWGQKENYVNQLIFVNKKVEDLVDEIMLKSEVPPIIVLQADHGSASTFTHPDGGGWENPTEIMLKERMRIFNAYYLPSDGSDILYDSITPVNTFRLVFDFFFNTDYGLLDDQSYYSTYDSPYELINVTDKVR